MTHSIKILHLEDVQSDAELVERILKKSGIEFEKVLVDTREEFIHALHDFKPDVILSDHSLPAFNSLEALMLLKETNENIPFILITATVSEEFAVNVMKEGASDYVLKDRLQRLPSAIINALGKFQSDAEKQVYLNKIVASEALFTKAETIAEFGTWRIDLVSNVTTWSAGTYALLGYDYDEVEPGFENFVKNVYPDDIAFAEEVFRMAFAGHHSGEADFRVINKDGSTRHVRTQYEFESDNNGRNNYITGFNQDITRQKLAREEIQRNMDELQAASDRQTAILNAMPPNMVLLSEDGKIVAVNESWRKLTLANNLGIPRYGTGVSYIAIAEKATGMDSLSARKIARGIKDVIAEVSDEFSEEYTCYLQNKKLSFQLVVAPLRDKTRKGAVVLHIDITALKEAEELMLKSKANLQTIFENTDVAYVLCDPEQKIVSFNSKANELSLDQFGKKAKVGGHVFNYFPKNRMPHIREAISKVSQNETLAYETSYELKDGTTKWYDVKWVGVTDDNGMNIGFILAFNDITGRKIEELEREHMTVDLIQRNKDLEQFAYIISHNLRAPVANIIGASNALKNMVLTAKEREKLNEGISNSVIKLDEIVNDLNQILQLQGTVNEKREVVCFSELVEDVKVSTRSLIDKDNVQITYDFSEVDEFLTFKPYLHSIFFNLISNSIKYRRPMADSMIEIRSQLAEGKIALVFTDNGMGIDLAKKGDQIFGLYKRFHSNIEGKGVGLFMVKTHVETLGGKITVASEVDKGTEFKIEFKL